MVASVRPVNRTMVRGSGLRRVECSYAHPPVSRAPPLEGKHPAAIRAWELSGTGPRSGPAGATARRLREAKKNHRRPTGRGS